MEERVFDGFAVSLSSQEAIHQPPRVQMRNVHDLQMIYMRRVQCVVGPTAWALSCMIGTDSDFFSPCTVNERSMNANELLN
jgi:hypothetical protein